MPPTRHSNPLSRPCARRPSPAGFTLVELLVVIGIIVVLIAILLPTIGKARIVAQSAKTQATMSSLTGAIERYYNDEKAYPGVVRNADITNRFAVAGGNLTMAENLTLALCGGLRYNGDDRTKPTYDPDDVGKGPLILSPFDAKRTRRPAYIDAQPGTLFPVTYAPTNASTGVINGPNNLLEMAGEPDPGPAGSDTNVPEFVDGYSTPRALLYLRAVAGAPNSTASAQNYNDDTVQYNTAHLLPYSRKAAGDFQGDFTFDPNVNADDYKNWVEYLKHPTVANAPRAKDKFIVISAGPDRRYGTNDDIIVGG